MKPAGAEERVRLVDPVVDDPDLDARRRRRQGRAGPTAADAPISARDGVAQRVVAAVRVHARSRRRHRRRRARLAPGGSSHGQPVEHVAVVPVARARRASPARSVAPRPGLLAAPVVRGTCASRTRSPSTRRPLPRSPAACAVRARTRPATAPTGRRPPRRGRRARRMPGSVLAGGTRALRHARAGTPQPAREACEPRRTLTGRRSQRRRPAASSDALRLAQPCGLGRVRPDRDAAAPRAPPSCLRRPGRARDDRAGVAHRLARRRLEPAM